MTQASKTSSFGLLFNPAASVELVGIEAGRLDELGAGQKPAGSMKAAASAKLHGPGSRRT